MAAPNNNNPVPVTTFVFLDLEATGLAGIGERPRITEISLVATHRTSLLEKRFRNTPRVLNKLTLCFDPCKAIGSEASNLTGLYNDELSLQCPFNEGVADLCTFFFDQLPPPVCLLSHNGHKYDFPLLIAELLNIGRSFPADILCVDTLDCFKDIMSIKEVQETILKRTRSMKPSTESNGVKMQERPERTQHSVVRRLIMKDTDGLPLPSITPDMQYVKINDNITKAPMKKPISKEKVKASRVSSAKRKLEFGEPLTSELAKNLVDDVDREDVMDDIHGFHLTTTGSQIRKINDKVGNNNISVVSEHSAGSSNMWEDGPPDDLLLDVLDEYEQNISETNISNAISISTVTNGTPLKSSADMMQDPAGKVGDMSNAVLSMEISPSNIISTSVISYPTPPPSERKNVNTFISNLSPLATPFVPQRLRKSNRVTPKSNELGISMALASLHKRVLGYDPPDTHRAEDDCMALLRIGNELNPWFCEWIDKHTSLFSETTPMYKPAKRSKKP